MSDFLETIVARTRERIRDLPLVDPGGVRRRHAFADALSGGQAILPAGQAGSPVVHDIRVIAEIKSASPSAGSIVADPNVEAIAAEYKRGGAAAISIVVEPEFFRGSEQWIGRAATTGLPVLMKEFVIDRRQLMCGVAAGASAILLLASLLDATQIREFIAMLDDYGVDALVEVHDEGELDRAIGGGARIIGVNNRNLRDFKVDLATAETLSARMPRGVIKVAESGIKTKADVDRLRAAGFNAFLVGESLLRQNDRAAAVKALTS